MKTHNKFTFNTDKPFPVSWEYRYSYKLAQIVLFLKLNSIGSKSSLIKLHFLSWVTRNSNQRELILDKLNSLSDFYTESWWIDPALNRALSIGAADWFILFHSKRYKLTKKGEELYKIIIENDMFSSEITFLKLLGKKVTEWKISLISKIK